jgi:flagellar protein FlbD
MINLTRLNKSKFVLNCEIIETIEATPDTVITTLNGKKIVVKETVEKIVEEVLEYRKRILLLNRLDE